MDGRPIQSSNPMVQDIQTMVQHLLELQARNVREIEEREAPLLARLHAEDEGARQHCGLTTSSSASSLTRIM